MFFYVEECVFMLVVIFSGGDKMFWSIVIIDWDFQKGIGCIEGYMGILVVVFLVVGMIVLMLQVWFCFMWCDVQYIIVFIVIWYEDCCVEWVINEVGFSYSYQYGFGLFNVWRFVNVVKIWIFVFYLVFYVSFMLKENKVILQFFYFLEVLWNVSRMDLEMFGLKILEYVVVIVFIIYLWCGSLELKLFCFSGMMFFIGVFCSMDLDFNGFNDWIFFIV